MNAAWKRERRIRAKRSGLVRCPCGTKTEYFQGRMIEHTTPNGAPCDGAPTMDRDQPETPCSACGLYICEHGSR